MTQQSGNAQSYVISNFSLEKITVFSFLSKHSQRSELKMELSNSICTVGVFDGGCVESDFKFK